MVVYQKYLNRFFLTRFGNTIRWFAWVFNFTAPEIAPIVKMATKMTLGKSRFFHIKAIFSDRRDWKRAEDKNNA